MESATTLSLHAATLVSTLAILAVLLTQHKVWVRMTDRLNTLWRHHCTKTGDPYTSLHDKNGH